jgi:LacI family transcriptional regulator
VDLTYKHLSKAGYERFAFAGLIQSAMMQRRLTLLRKKLGRGNGLDAFDLSFVKYDETTEPKSSRALEQWLRGLRPPVGIIAWSGFHASCICAACREVGLKIPQDVGVFSISDDRWCVFSDPAISAVCADGDGLGYAAMKMLATELRGRRPPEQLVQVAPREVIARGSAERGETRAEHIASAVAYIELHAFEGIGVDDVLRTTQMISRRKFYDDFAAQVGCSPADYIRQIKIARGRELLSTTTLSLKRIAPACGFQNVPRFYDAFTRMVGSTPVAYRRQEAGKRKTWALGCDVPAEAR